MQDATVSRPLQHQLQHCDVLIIGGGPAGSTAAALLAQRGITTVLIDKDRHPRFHIGESLLPANVPLFEELGVLQQVQAIGMPKWGVEFNSLTHSHTSSIEFANAWDKRMPNAYQVRRSQFDELLLRNAASKGATVIEACRAQDMEFNDDAVLVQAEHEDGRKQSWRAQYVLDASGRNTFITNKLSTKIKNKKHGSSAIYGHYTNAERLPGKREGDISIFWFEHGWFWFIPLADGTTSIGAVCWPYYLASRKKPLKDFLADTIAMNHQLKARLVNATLVDDQVYATGNYSYTSQHSHGERYLLLGDAFAFVDPVFSSGVLLAMKSAFVATDAIEAALKTPERKARAFKAFDRHVRKGPRVFSWFIYRVTNPMMRELFMQPRDGLKIKEGLTSVLAGDIYDNRAIWPSVFAFKMIYWIGSLINARRSLKAYGRRLVNIQDVPLPPVSQASSNP